MALLICRPFTNGCSTYMGSKTSTLQRSPATDSQKVLVVTCESPHCVYLSYTQGEVTSQSLWSRYDRHFLGTTRYNAHTHTHTRLTALFPGLPGWAGTRKVKPIWILLKQQTVSGSGISWSVCIMQVCTSLQTDNHASTPLLSFLQAGCPSCHPANSVKARVIQIKLNLSV